MEAVVLIFPHIFLHKATRFERPFLKAVKCQSNNYSVRLQNIVCLFKLFSSIEFNNFLGMKTKNAYVNHKF